MNIIRCREQLQELYKRGIILESHYREYLQAPIFIYEQHSLAEMEMEWAVANLCGGNNGFVPVKMPFEFVTIITKIHDKAGPPMDAVLRATNRLHEGVVSWEDDGKLIRDKVRSILTCHLAVSVDGQKCVLVARHTGERARGICVEVYRNYIPCTPSELDHGQDDAANIPRDILLRFCFDVLNPNSIVLRVEPPRGNVPRSAEWRMARTHYLILNRKQAIACRDQKRGPSDHEIVRAAHWRRAHMRRLVSPKFIHKKGQLVFVKQAWVGPDEWVGLDDKTYKVINPNEN